MFCDGIERFDKEQSDEEPCGTSRRRSGARQLPTKSLSPAGHERLKSAKEQKHKTAANKVCGAGLAFLRKRDFKAAWKKRQKKWSCNNPTISATLFKAAKSHKVLVINAVYSRLRTRVLTAVFALLILRSSKSPLKSKGLALFGHHRYHSAENFLHQSPSSWPKEGVVPPKTDTNFMTAQKRRNGNARSLFEIVLKTWIAEIFCSVALQHVVNFISALA